MKFNLVILFLALFAATSFATPSANRDENSVDKRSPGDYDDYDRYDRDRRDDDDVIVVVIDEDKH